MKKIATLFLSLLIAVALFAQTTDDALNLAQEYYEGTARSMAMGNAFTALGGDLGAISINPASSGVLRYSQITFTPSLTTTVHNTGYLGHTNSTKNTGLTVSNFGTVLSFDTGNYNGLLNYSFGFVYNKKNSFRSGMAAEGTTNNSSMLSSIAAGLEGVDWQSIDLEKTTNPYVSSGASWPGILAWNTYVLAPLSFLGGKYADVNDSYMASTENYNELTDELQIGGDLRQRFNRKTRGSNEEFALNFGGNISDFLYFGMNLNIHTVNQTTEEYYEEVAVNPSDFQDGFVSMDNSFWLHTVGSGINFKAGVIVTPFAGLRLGATITTPTRYTLTDEWDYTMNTAFNNGNTYTGYTPTGTYAYKLTTPMRWSVGAAYTFLDKGLLSVDYEHVNYAATRFTEERGGAGNFADVDYAIEHTFTNAHILRVGAEIRATDFLSIRGGYQQYSPAVKGASSRNAYSAGLGFNISPTFSIDLAWSRLAGTTDTFQLYDDYSSAVTVPTGTNWHSMSKAVCTLAIKF
jgi:hypothetical protein